MELDTQSTEPLRRHRGLDNICPVWFVRRPAVARALSRPCDNGVLCRLLQGSHLSWRRESFTRVLDEHFENHPDEWDGSEDGENDDLILNDEHGSLAGGVASRA